MEDHFIMLDYAVRAPDPAFLGAAVALMVALLPAVAPDLKRHPRVALVLRWLLGSRRQR